MNMLRELIKIAIISLSFSGLGVQSKNVVELNAKNFDALVDGRKFVFVFFYAPWHKHCQKIVQKFDQVGQAFSDRDDIIVGKVNAYEEVKLATRLWVDDYPMFRFFIKGSTTEERLVTSWSFHRI